MTLIELIGVSKVFCRDFDLAQKFSVADMFRLGSPGRALRPMEFFALKDVSLKLEEGEKLLVLGLPDSGKTVLARILAGLSRPTHGTAVRRGTVQIAGLIKWQNSYATLNECLRLGFALSGESPFRIDQKRRLVLDFCEAHAWADTRLYAVPENIVERTSAALPLFLDADVLIFERMPRVHETSFKPKYEERLRGALASRTCVFLQSRPSEMPCELTRTIILHGGELLYDGLPASGESLFLDFADRIAEQPAEPPANVFRRCLLSARSAPAQWAVRKKNFTTPESLRQEVGRVVGSGKEVLVGPWLANVGVELLYWIPFLNWARRECGLEPERTVAISRAGTQGWYAEVAHRYVDVLDLFDYDTYRRLEADRFAETGSLKQFHFSRAEQSILEAAIVWAGVKDFELLHPSLLNKFFSLVWRHQAAPEAGLSVLDFDQSSSSLQDVAPEGFRLPPDYVAVRLDHNICFPDNEANRAWAEGLVRALAARHPVVLLNTGTRFDDHAEFEIPSIPNVIDLTSVVGHRQCLALQTAVLRRASGYAGPYGGISYLAGFLGKPGFQFCSMRGGFFGVHARINEEACSRMGRVALPVYDTAALSPEQAADFLAASGVGEKVS